MSEREGLKRGYWQSPRWLGDELIDGNLTPVEYALVTLAASRREAGLADGWPTTLDQLAAILKTPQRTARRALNKVHKAELLEHDLRQGQRNPFRITLGRRLLKAEVVAEVVAEVEPDRTDSWPKSSTSESALPSGSEPTRFDPLAEVSRLPDTETETETDTSTPTVGGRRVVDADDSPQVVDVVTAAQDDAPNHAGDGDGERDVVGDPVGEVGDERRDVGLDHLRRFTHKHWPVAAEEST